LNKPPAFQFYSKDWLTSETVLAMSERDQGLFIHLLAHSWNSSEPGTLPLPLTLTAKLTAKPLLRLAWFLKRHPGTFREVNGRLLNDKLYANWLYYKELSEKRRAAANIRHDASASHLHQTASASAFASAKDLPLASLAPSENSSEGERGFAVFWTEYPRKIGKPAALRAWLKVAKDGELILVGLRVWKSCEQWRESERFIPYPATFLNQRRYNDKPSSSQGESFDEIFDRVAARRAKGLV
jgi:hypothetical protein